ncbi:carbohydrate ABC transporter permease [Mycolicibacterium arenosum]|uniref:Sugar ABC transporter permease n=1 Tax=Mycolicibacterium arenosum TaxID=2952157 RepID=A0ABT1MBN5_9MYCO|nr:sugar ABC transporter permease [Mycolicibacterium sp. CAU 1645]MCP9276561.1 sugar ABC transporter permease [Mycolicibacterium sp. CAU 1645]
MSLPIIASEPRSNTNPTVPLSRRGNRHTRAALVLIAPAVVLTLLVEYVPTALSLFASFFQIPLSGDEWTFVGLGNFQAIVVDSDVQQAVWNTFLYCAITILPSLVLGLGGALLINSLSRGRGWVSAVLFLPLTANLVAMAVVFEWIFALNGGFANAALGLVGVSPVNFLGDATTALPTVASVGVWRSASFCMVLFLAGLTTIPAAIHEAAAMDGVRGWAKLRDVTLPMLRTTTVVAVVLTTVQTVQTFETVQVMTDGGPLGETESVLSLTWRIGFGYFQLGAASALSFLLLLFLLALGLYRRRAILRGAS